MPKKAHGHKIGNSQRVYLRDAENAAAQTVRLARKEGFIAGRETVITLLEREVYSGADPIETLVQLRVRDTEQERGS